MSPTMTEAPRSMPKTKSPHILYLFSDTGGGHRASTNALIAAVEELYAGATPKQTMVDAFAATNGFLNFLATMYGPLVNRYPKVWGKLWYFFESEKAMRVLEFAAKPLMIKGLVKLIEKQNPDLIVSVHPLVNHLMVRAIRQTGRKIPFITVVTDPVDVHRTWVSPDVDLLVVATEEAVERCLTYGIAPHKIALKGLPVHPKFLRPAPPAAETRKKLGLDPDRRTILVMGGGEGGGEMDRLVKHLIDTNDHFQLIVVAGRNKPLENTLLEMKKKAPMPMAVFGFSNEIPELMSASDILVGKGGPGALAEALTKEIPIVVTSWLPGQEEGNAEYVDTHELGALCTDYSKIGETVQKLLTPESLARVRANVHRVSRPRAAYEIADLFFKFL